jgi:lysophospholipase L1-like esterase
MVIGDSIAVGVAQQRPECRCLVQGGLNSWQWNKKYKQERLSAKNVIISLGTNDHDGVHTYKELMMLRSRVSDADRVFWIMPPIKPPVQDIVAIIANAHGDIIIKTDRLQADKIHPSTAGYKELANETRKTDR